MLSLENFGSPTPEALEITFHGLLINVWHLDIQSVHTFLIIYDLYAPFSSTFLKLDIKRAPAPTI